MRTNHPFSTWNEELDTLNVVDELGRKRCADCGMPRGIHPEDEPERVLDAEDLRRQPF